MKIALLATSLIAAVALAVPAEAATKKNRKQVQQKPYAAAQLQPGEVFYQDRVVGRDPDPFIRFMIGKDPRPQDSHD